MLASKVGMTAVIILYRQNRCSVFSREDDHLLSLFC